MTRDAVIVCCSAILTVALHHVMGHVIMDNTLEQAQKTEPAGSLDEVMDGLSDRVDRLTVRMQAQGTRMDIMSSQIAAVLQPVAFSALFTAPDMEQLEVGNSVKFDQVLFNTGAAYDPTTGVFTAPSSGNYAFYLHVLLNATQPQDFEADLYKDKTLLLKVAGCCSGYDTRTNMATVTLEKGETTHVQVVTDSVSWGSLLLSFTGFKLNS